MKIINSILTIFLSLIIFSCSSSDDNYYKDLCKQHRDFDNMVIVNLIDADQSFEICISNTTLYKYIYKKYFNNEYQNFCDFLIPLIQKKIILKKEYVFNLPYFIIVKTDIDHEYKQKGFNFITEKYLEIKDSLYSAKTDLTENQEYSLIKIMFIEGYSAIFDGYSGEWIFRKYN